MADEPQLPKDWLKESVRATPGSFAALQDKPVGKSKTPAQMVAEAAVKVVNEIFGGRRNG